MADLTIDKNRKEKSRRENSFATFAPFGGQPEIL
jgi:hypothetical protein